jgi:hypothetical protein
MITVPEVKSFTPLLSNTQIATNPIVATKKEEKLGALDIS